MALKWIERRNADGESYRSWSSNLKTPETSPTHTLTPWSLVSNATLRKSLAVCRRPAKQNAARSSHSSRSSTTTTWCPHDTRSSWKDWRVLLRQILSRRFLNERRLRRPWRRLWRKDTHRERTDGSSLLWVCWSGFKTMVDGWLTYVFCRILNDSSASSGPDGMGCYIMALVA